MRRIVLWIPDWPVASLVVDLPPGAAGAVVARQRIECATAQARHAGVRSGMRLATAQYLCPELMCLARDSDREGRAFEIVLDAFDSVAAGVACLRPGLAWAPAAPIVRWSGGEETAATLVLDAVNEACGVEAFIGIADSPLAALEAARASRIVSADSTLSFLADIPLERALPLFPSNLRAPARDAIVLLDSLGVRTCAQVRDLGRAALFARFGLLADPLWSLVNGQELFIEEGVRVQRDRRVEILLEDEEMIDRALLSVRRGAVELADELDSHGLNAQILDIACETVDGRLRTRTWTGVDINDPQSVVDWVRWQLKGWRDAAIVDDSPGAALMRIVLTACEPAPRSDRTPLWGRGQDIDRVEEVAARLQSLLGRDGLVVPYIHGGYDPRTRTSTIPWHEDPPCAPPREGEWEGGVDLFPSTLFDTPIPVDLTSTPPVVGPIDISERGILLAEPAYMRRADSGPDPYAVFGPTGMRALTRTGGPWVVRGRWWKPVVGHEPRAYITARIEKGPEILLSTTGAAWWVEGLYE